MKKTVAKVHEDLMGYLPHTKVYKILELLSEALESQYDLGYNSGVDTANIVISRELRKLEIKGA